VEMVDANRDGQLEIVHSNAAGLLVTRDGSGNILSRKRVAEYLGGFSVCNRPDNKHPTCLLKSSDDAILLLDYDGSTIARLKAPRCKDMWDAYAVPVKLKPGAEEYLAVVAASGRGGVSVFYLYDPGRKLVYEEVLPSGYSVAATPLDSSGAEQIMVGGDGIVWSFTLKTP